MEEFRACEQTGPTLSGPCGPLPPPSRDPLWSPQGCVADMPPSVAEFGTSELCMGPGYLFISCLSWLFRGVKTLHQQPSPLPTFGTSTACLSRCLPASHAETSFTPRGVKPPSRGPSNGGNPTRGGDRPGERSQGRRKKRAGQGLGKPHLDSDHSHHSGHLSMLSRCSNQPPLVDAAPTTPPCHFLRPLLACLILKWLHFARACHDHRRLLASLRTECSSSRACFSLVHG